MIDVRNQKMDIFLVTAVYTHSRKHFLSQSRVNDLGWMLIAHEDCFVEEEEKEEANNVDWLLSNLNWLYQDGKSA